jgi:hypothetical protein
MADLPLDARYCCGGECFWVINGKASSVKEARDMAIEAGINPAEYAKAIEVKVDPAEFYRLQKIYRRP